VPDLLREVKHLAAPDELVRTTSFAVALNFKACLSNERPLVEMTANVDITDC